MKLRPHPITLRQLQYVVAVADLRSFRGAADACGVSEPSLSAQVAEAEEQLGVRLFDRDTQGVSITVAGLDVVADARKALAAMDAVLDTASRFRDPLNGPLRIGVIPTISPYLVPAASRALRESHPALTLLWAEEQTTTLLRRLRNRELDAAIVADGDDLGDLVRQPLARDAFVAALPAGHPLCERETIELDDLFAETLLLLDEGHCLRAQALAVCGAAAVREHPFRATSLQTLLQMVAQGAGVTLLPSMARALECTRSNIVVRPLREPVGRDVVLAFRERAPLSSCAGEVTAVLRGAVPT